MQRACLTPLCFGVALLLASQHAAADFNPRGRQRKAAPQAAAKRPVQTKPSAPEQTATDPSRRSSEALIARYMAIVLRQPGAVFPLQRLSELYRERDGNADGLVQEFETRLKGQPDSLSLRLALAWTYRQTAQRDRALALLEGTVALHPKDPAAYLALADLHEADGDPLLTRRWLDQALPLVSAGPVREQLLRRLRALALDAKDISAARTYHEQLVSAAQGSFYVRSELGRELLDRGFNQEAEAELERVARSATGDNRTLAPALRDLARAQAAQQQTEKALSTLQRALRLTSGQSGLRRELLDVMVGVYRQANRIAELITVLEKESAGDFTQLQLLGGLYEETGRIAEALKVYRKALRQNNGNIDVRIKVVHLLELQGDLPAATTEYQALIRSDPRNPEYVFQLVELLLQRGERAAAMDELQALTARFKQDPQILASVVDFYERVGESEKSVALLEQVATLSSSDPQHLVELGGRYFAQGDEKRAVQTWKRILAIVPDRAKALHLLGEIYLEHDMTSDALDSLSQAAKLAPTVTQYQKSYALALERTGAASTRGVRLQRYAEAQKIWESLLSGPSGSPHLMREARQHIVTLWSLQGTLQDRIKPLELAFRSRPPHVPSGRILAEVYQRINEPQLAERVLRDVVKLAPGDSETWSTLERVLVAQRKLHEALQVAQKLVELDPKRAREHYQRLSKYATDLYLDDQAIEFASKAVALSPDDATGHKRLGDMYRRRQDIARAIAEYRKALSKNERLFPAYFDLAELLLFQEKPEEANQLLRKVMRSAVDDELIARATRLSMQLHITDNTLGILEHELLPLALSQPQKTIYRRLLVELYGAWAFPLIQRLSNPDPEQRATASSTLQQIGQRAVKPLLDALTDEKGAQQRVAIELLTHLRNDNATLPLLVYARSDADPELRARAMIAAGSSGGTALLGPLEDLLFKDGHPDVDEADPVALAAVWAFTKIDSPKAVDGLFVLLGSDAPSVQALALLSLARQQARGTQQRLLPMLDDSVAPIARAAAAYAAGAVKAAGAVSRLRRLALSSDPLTRVAALTALGRMADPQLPSLAAQALVSADANLRRDAAAALGVYVSGQYAPRATSEPVFGYRIQVSELLQAQAPQSGSPDTNAKALIALAPDLTEVARAALVGSDASALGLIDALLGGVIPGLSPLTDNTGQASAANRDAATAVADQLVHELLPEFVVLSTHPNADVRAGALRVLASRHEAAASDALGHALQTSDSITVRAALAAIVEYRHAASAADVLQLLDATRPWPLRQLAAQTLTRLPAVLLSDLLRKQAVDALREQLHRDPNAFVRQACLQAMSTLAPEQTRADLEAAHLTDVEARVRDTASALLEGQP